jgi:hypothetical protein
VKKGSRQKFDKSSADAGVGARRRRRTPMKIMVPSRVPDATRTHAFRVYMSEALVYIKKKAPV